MAFNNKDLKRINDLIAIKHTMPPEVYIKKLQALRQEIVNDIVVDYEAVNAERNIMETVNHIIKPSLN